MGALIFKIYDRINRARNQAHKRMSGPCAHVHESPPQLMFRFLAEGSAARPRSLF